MLAACGDRNMEGDSDKPDELDKGEIESEIYSALVGGSETYSIQNNGVDIQDKSSVHSRLTVNLETNSLEYSEMVSITEKDTEIIANLLSEIEVITSVEVKWLYNYNGIYYTFNLERDGDQLVVQGKELDEETLNRHIGNNSSTSE